MKYYLNQLDLIEDFGQLNFGDLEEKKIPMELNKYH